MPEWRVTHNGELVGFYTCSRKQIEYAIGQLPRVGNYEVEMVD